MSFWTWNDTHGQLERRPSCTDYTVCPSQFAGDSRKAVVQATRRGCAVLPQVEFPAAIRKISSRISLPTGLRPLGWFWRRISSPAESRRGATPPQFVGSPGSAASAIQTTTFLRGPKNNLCQADSQLRNRVAPKASNCWRRARFSSTRSLRAPNALRIQPMRCRSDENMAQIVPD
jgi:hypothetical protein